MFVESFVKILHGDRAALERLYAIELQERPASEPASEGRWSLALTPLVSPMNKVFARIELEGQRMDLASMTMIELDGDKTVTTFSDVDTARQFSAEEHARVFSVAPAP